MQRRIEIVNSLRDCKQPLINQHKLHAPPKGALFDPACFRDGC